MKSAKSPATPTEPPQHARSSCGAPDGDKSQAGRNPRKHQQILDGARRVFTEMGFDAASMNDITRAAGVSKGTVYVYFANKEELFEALVDDERSKLFANLYRTLRNKTDADEDAQVVASTEELRETLIAFGCALSEQLCSEPVVRAQRTVIAVAARMPSLGKRFFDKGPLRGHQILVDYLKAASASGLLTTPDIELAAFQLFELFIAGILRARLFCHASDPPSRDEISHIVTSGVDMFLAAYGT
ncbi:MAG: TetR/AcrR family transcriptional regulator [Alphaproteobacteria bacterium]|nr:TetR/AcrR family transcriptional regulator [Alphaproteobacteria bacterium]